MLRIAESGGDGIYLGQGRNGETCRNTVIRRCDCDRNHRQGVSVITANGLLIEDTKLRNTIGTAPKAWAAPQQDNWCAKAFPPSAGEPIGPLVKGDFVPAGAKVEAIVTADPGEYVGLTLARRWRFGGSKIDCKRPVP